MSIYNWLCLIGVPGLVAGIVGIGVARIKKTNAELQAVKLGVQALLRDRLLQAIGHYATRGYATFADRSNVMNMYNQYHSLGKNGVMDDVYKKFLELPMRKEEDSDE